jgi:hypothetical protein
MIGAARYFNPRFWAERYFPKLGAVSVASDAIGELTSDGASSLLGGDAAFSTLGGGLDAADLGGVLSASVLGGDLS